MSIVSAVRRHRLPSLIAAAAVVVVAGFLVIYFGLFSSSSPKKLTLSANGQPATLKSSQLPGSWTISAGSVVGYRVREKLGALPATDDAVGRTSQVTGTVTLKSSGGRLTASAANFNANVATLTSDKARRDNYIRTHGLQTAQFPQATFVQSGDINVPGPAEKGQRAPVPATGNLTIHGVTKQVSIPLNVQLNGSQIQIVGSIQFPFSEFGMSPPSIGGFVTVTDNATLEFSLLLSRQ